MPFRRACFLALLLGCGPSAPVPSARAAVSLPTDFVDETVLSGFAEPTSFAFLPDGRVLLTEQRTGRVRMVVGGHIATTDPVVTVDSLNAAGNERGLLAIAIDPAWPDRPFVYLYYNRRGSRLRLARYTAVGDLDDPNGEALTLTSRLLLINDIPDFASNHNGGALRFDSFGHLFLSIGEDADGCGAQDSTRLKGVLLRMDVAGLPPGGGGPVLRAAITPPDNPLSTPDSNARLVWAYGLRNPFRYHVDPLSDKVYVGDVGQNTIEEMDEVLPGDNLGWPFREGPIVQSPFGCFEPGGPGGSPYKGPIASYDHSAGTAIISAGIYRRFPERSFAWPVEFDGDVFFADYYGGFLRRIKNGGGTWAPASSPGQPNTLDWATDLDSPADFLLGPDGSLWWMSQFDANFSANSGSLRRIRYTGLQLDAPHPLASSRRLAAAPSPFRSSVELSFELAAEGDIRLAIFDLAGREVRRLLEGRAPAGRRRVTWDGLDRVGRAVPAGVYLARLDRANGHEMSRVLRLR